MTSLRGETFASSGSRSGSCGYPSIGASTLRVNDSRAGPYERGKRDVTLVANQNEQARDKRRGHVTSASVAAGIENVSSATDSCAPISRSLTPLNIVPEIYEDR